MKNSNIHMCMHISKPHSPLLLSTIQNHQKNISQEEATVLMLLEKYIQNKKLVILDRQLSKCKF